MSRSLPLCEIRLVDLLRRRRELPLAEVARLCADLPALLDGPAESGGARAGKLGALRARPRDEHARVDRWLAQPVTGWSPFSLRVTNEQEPGEDETLTRPAGGSPAQGPAALAHVLYELLGGACQTGAANHYPPLPALNEAGNSLLRAALLDPHRPESCAEFWERWLRACELPPPGLWRIPRWLLHISSPGTSLSLHSDSSIPPVELIARPRFRLGRSRSRSDFPTRAHRPDGGLDEALTAQFSRVQMLGEWTGTNLAWRDGDGEKASTNGTEWEHRPLSSTQATPFSAPGVLTLARCYGLQATPVSATIAEDTSPIVNLASWSGADQPRDLHSLDFGAVVFRPLDGQPITRDAVWFGRELAFEPGQGGRLEWAIRPPGRAPARILRLHGSFWIANCAVEGSALRLNDASLEPGQIAPLAEGQDLEIAGRRYKIKVS